jgi:hypothetical protein
MSPKPPDMTHAKARGWTSRRSAVVAGAVAATTGASALYASVFREWDAWFALDAAIAGGLFGHLMWVCVDVRHRVTRPAAILVVLCLAAWAIFLLFGAPHEWPQPPPRSDYSIDVIHDLPVMVAGRAVGVFGSVNGADRLLGLLAQPAIQFASRVVGLATATISEHTVAQSYGVAGIAIVLSAAWWLACGNAVSALRRRRTERRAVIPAAMQPGPP